VAQPTILDVAKEYNSTAEYFPIPYDPELFYPKPMLNRKREKLVFLASAHDFKVKGTDKFIYACAKVRVPFKLRIIDYGKDAEKAKVLARKLGLNVEVKQKVSHENMNRLYWDADLVMGSFGVGQLDTVAIEAMACGRPVVHHILKDYFPQCPLEEFYSVEEVTGKISELLVDRKKAEDRYKKQLDYVSNFHMAPKLALRLAKMYSKMM